MPIKVTPELEEAWLAACGKKANLSNVLKVKILSTGQFIAEHWGVKKAAEFLSGIDVSKQIVQEKLKEGVGVYIQYKGKYQGSWFTQTGLTPDMVGLAEGKRLRKLFTPKSNVTVLRSTAKSIKDTWTPDRLIQSFDPREKKYGQMTSGGGVQYLVPNSGSNMQEL